MKAEAQELARTKQEILTVDDAQQKAADSFRRATTAELAKLKQDLSTLEIDTMPKWAEPQPKAQAEAAEARQHAVALLAASRTAAQWGGEPPAPAEAKLEKPPPPRGYEF